MQTFGDKALEFARALMRRDFAAAHAMLAQALHAELTASKLQSLYDGMVAPYGSPVLTAEVMETMADWPAKQPADLGWAYVAIAGDRFSEAVTVVLTREDGRVVIREVTWGRP